MTNKKLLHISTIQKTRKSYLQERQLCLSTNFCILIIDYHYNVYLNLYVYALILFVKHLSTRLPASLSYCPSFSLFISPTSLSTSFLLFPFLFSLRYSASLLALQHLSLLFLVELLYSPLHNGANPIYQKCLFS